MASSLEATGAAGAAGAAQDGSGLRHQPRGQAYGQLHFASSLSVSHTVSAGHSPLRKEGPGSAARRSDPLLAERHQKQKR